MKIRIYVMIFIIPFFFGCSNKNYRQIVSIRNHYNIDNATNNITLSHKNFDPSKKIFAKLNGILSDDFVFIFSWVNYLPKAGTNHFSSLIYDKKVNKTYYIYNEEDKIGTIRIEEINADYDEERFILDYYLKGKIDILSSLSPPFISSEIGAEYYLFDTTTNKAHVIKNLVLTNEGEIFR